MPADKPLKLKVESGEWKILKSFSTLLLCLFFLTAKAQDSDSLKVKKVHNEKHSAAKAMLFSAICPGLGQIYNHKYWKLPIIYVGLGVATYFIITNQNYYNTYSDAVSDTKNPYYGLYTSDQLSDIINYYHRNRDLSVIIAAGIYILNLVDANVDAQMNGFNVSDDISVKFSPNLVPNPMSGTMCFQAGFKLVKRF
jgi:hypothetical protein